MSVVSISLDGSIKLWETSTGKLINSFDNAHKGGVLALAFTLDSCCIVTSGLDNTARIWQLSLARNSITLPGHGQPVSGVAASTNGLIATASWDGNARIWDARTGAFVRGIRVGTQQSQLNGVAFSPNARWLATVDTDGNAKVWATATLQLAKSLPLGFSAQAVVFSPDGRFLAAAANRTVHIWDTQDWNKIVERTAHGGPIYSIAFSPDSKRLATAGEDHMVKLWPIRMELEQLTLAGHDGPVRSVAFSPDGSSIVTASEDGTARVWTTSPTGENLAINVGPEVLRTVAFSPDGRRIVSEGPEKNTAAIWDAHTGERLRDLVGHSDGVLDARFNLDGTRIATGSRDRTVRLWDADTGREIRSFPAGGWAHSVAFDPSGTWLAAAAYSRIHVWSLHEPLVSREYSDHTEIVNQLVFSPDGTLVASASNDHSVQVWAAQTPSLRFRLSEAHNFHSVAFLPGGRSVIAGAEDGTLRYWRFKEGQTETIPQRHTRAVQRIALSRNGKRMATAGSDRMVQIWDPRTSDNVLSLHGHEGEITDIAFSPDDTRLLTAASDGAIRGFWIDRRRLREFATTRVTRTSLREELRKNDASMMSHLW
jgi:WD40 repeat protein